MAMTIEQAINELEDIRDFEVTYSGYRDALNIAIDALKEKIAPAAEPEEESDEETGADDNDGTDTAADCVATNCTDECPKGGYEEDGKTVCELYAEKSDRIREIHEEVEIS